MDEEPQEIPAPPDPQDQPFRGVMIDTETGGFQARKHALLQIGAVAFSVCPHCARVEIDDVLSIDVKPAAGFNITKGALRTIGMTRDQVLHRPTAIAEGAAIADLARFLDTYADRSAWAWAASFDADFIYRATKRSLARNAVEEDAAKRLLALPRTLCCARQLAMAQAALKIHAVDKTSLDTWAGRFGLQDGKRGPHNAVGDAILAINVMARLIGPLRRLSGGGE